MSSQTHSIVSGSERVPLPGATPQGATDPQQEVHVVLKLRRKAEPPVLTDRPATIMSREELADRFGAAPEDVETVAAAFEKLGLRILGTNAATRSVEIAGTAAQMEKAFRVELVDYAHPSGDYRGRVGPVHVPAEVAHIVTGVFGLDNRRVAYRRRRQHALSPEQARALVASWYKPAELGRRYNFPDGDGAGETIGILEFGGGYFEQDLKQFCAIADVPVPDVTIVSVDGTPTDVRDGSEAEVMLDVEVVAGLCPKAHIVGYFAHFTEKGWIKVLDQVLQDKDNDPSVLSISWGYAEDADIWTRQAMSEVDRSLADAALLGITVCVAAGDDGSSDGVTHDGHAHADFPATSPHVLAVGGTTIPSRDTMDPDICWFERDGLRSSGGGSTGGGVSAVFPRPAWQQAISIESVNRGAIAGRCVPDIAANADWTVSPYLLVVDGTVRPNGGTSAATPLLAALIARINANRGAGRRIGYLTPLLYKVVAGGQTIGGSCCIEVVSGANVTAKAGGYKAGPGYNAVAGWGTPDGQKMIAVLATAAP